MNGLAHRDSVSGVEILRSAEDEELQKNSWVVEPLSAVQLQDDTR
jgi:hypothetical protein